MAYCKKCLPDLLGLDVHMFGTFLYFKDIWLLPVLHLFQIQNCPLFFGLKHMWGQIFKLVKHIFYISYQSKHFTHFSMCVWRILTLVGESCDPCWYSESSLFLHSWAWRDDQSSLSSGIAIWSFLFSFLYTLNVGMSNIIMILLYNHNKGLHITKLPFIPCHFHPLFCQVSV